MILSQGSHAVDNHTLGESHVTPVSSQGIKGVQPSAKDFNIASLPVSMISVAEILRDFDKSSQRN